MDYPKTTTKDKVASTKPITSQDIKLYEASLSHLNHDYNILVIEFDKDYDPNIKPKFSAVGLHTMDRLFDFEDIINDLKKAVTKREDRASKGRMTKVESIQREREILKSLGVEFETLRSDMMKLRNILEASEGYVYKKTSPNFMLVPESSTRGGVRPKKPVAEEIAEDTIFATCASFPSIPSGDNPMTFSPISPEDPPNPGHSSGSQYRTFNMDKKRKEHPNDYEGRIHLKKPRHIPINSSPTRAAQSEEEEYIPKRASKRAHEHKYNVSTSKASSKRSKNRRENGNPVAETTEEELEPPIIDERIIAEVVKRFSSNAATLEQEKENQNLKVKIDEQAFKIKEIGRHIEVILKERDELSKDRQDAWNALRETQRALIEMTDRKNAYKGMLKGSKKERSRILIEDSSTEESDS